VSLKEVKPPSDWPELTTITYTSVDPTGISISASRVPEALLAAGVTWVEPSATAYLGLNEKVIGSAAKRTTSSGAAGVPPPKRDPPPPISTDLKETPSLAASAGKVAWNCTTPGL
jgi:hypothetical protein